MAARCGRWKGWFLNKNLFRQFNTWRYDFLHLQILHSAKRVWLYKCDTEVYVMYNEAVFTAEVNLIKLIQPQEHCSRPLVVYWTRRRTPKNRLRHLKEILIKINMRICVIMIIISGQTPSDLIDSSVSSSVDPCLYFHPSMNVLAAYSEIFSVVGDDGSCLFSIVCPPFILERAVEGERRLPWRNILLSFNILQTISWKM